MMQRNYLPRWVGGREGKDVGITTRTCFQGSFYPVDLIGVW